MARKALIFQMLLAVLISANNHGSDQINYGLISGASAQLSPDFYSDTCPQVQEIVRTVMQEAVQENPRVGASVLRLLFHDCFVQGCDGSVLLDDTPNMQGEKSAGPNLNSLRGFEVIDSIKEQVEAACPGVVSCADIVALASRDGVALLNGPDWEVPLGRRDSLMASFNLANNNLPAPNSTISTLISKFATQGLSTLDLVALSGAHTIGVARCTTFRQRLYDEQTLSELTLEMSLAQRLQTVCPPQGGDNNLAPLDTVSSTTFDNQYFANLASGQGVLITDQVLLSSIDPSTTPSTLLFASDQDQFFQNFVASMIKMSMIGVLTGSQGEVRLNCRQINGF